MSLLFGSIIFVARAVVRKCGRWSAGGSAVAEQGGQIRLPRQQAQTNAALDGVVCSGAARRGQIPVAGAILQLQNLTSSESKGYFANGEGVFRVFPLAPGDYSLRVRAQGYAAFSLDKITLHANEVLTLEISLLAEPPAELRSRLPRLPELGAPLPAESVATAGSYRELRHRLDSDPNYALNAAPESLPPVADVFATVPDRCLLQQPEYKSIRRRGNISTRDRVGMIHSIAIV